MTKLITYKEEDLKSTLSFMDSSIDHIRFIVTMMIEQHEGKRSNLDMGISNDLMRDVINLETCLKSFKICL